MKFPSILRNVLKKKFDQIQNENFKTNLLQAIPFWAASIITGLLAVLYARLFSIAEKFTLLMERRAGWSFFIITPLCFIISWWLVKRFALFARGSGIPQVMAALEVSNSKKNFLADKLLNLRIVAVKIISSLLLVAGGGAIGREGPTIQIAASIFRKTNSLLPDWWPKVAKKNMIVTGAAAGLAAAFNTPVGGFVFAVEELTKTHISFFKTALFSAVIIAGLTAQVIAGPYLYLGYCKAEGSSVYIFMLIILTGTVSGLIASAMCRVILKIFRWKKSFKTNFSHIVFLFACGLLTASLAYLINWNMLGSGKELMTQYLFTTQKYEHWYIPVLRIIGPVLSFPSGGAGGIFAPALSAGATIGSYLAHLFDLLNGNANLLVLSGMVAFLTGVTRAPFTSSILVLEMTDRHDIIFHLMLAAMVANLVSVLIDSKSFYGHLKQQYLAELEK